MFDGTTYVSFKKNLNNLVLKEISEWSVGAIDALDKDYVSKSVIVTTKIIFYFVAARIIFNLCR